MKSRVCWVLSFSKRLWDSEAWTCFLLFCICVFTESILGLIDCYYSLKLWRLFCSLFLLYRFMKSDSAWKFWLFLGIRISLSCAWTELHVVTWSSQLYLQIFLPSFLLVRFFALAQDERLFHMCFLNLFCFHLFILLWIDHNVRSLRFIHLLIFSYIFIHWLSIPFNVYFNSFNRFSAFFIWVFNWEFIDFLQFLFLSNRLPLLFWRVLFIVSI